MKISRTGSAFLFLMLTGILIMAYFLVRYEARITNQNFQDKGAYMVSLMSLYHIQDFEAGRRDLMMRTS